MTGQMSSYPTSMTLSRQLIAQLRSEKARLAERSTRFWSYEDLLRAMLLHWQTMPPATLPTAEDLLITVNPDDKNVLFPVETPA